MSPNLNSYTPIDQLHPPFRRYAGAFSAALRRLGAPNGGQKVTERGSSGGLPRRLAFLIGAFPPPHHGVSNANSHMAGRFAQAGFEVRRLDLSPGNHRWPLRQLKRAFGAIKAGVRLIVSHRSPRVAYLGASAGLGRLYDVAILLAARLGQTQVVVHHHSYRYLNGRELLEAVVVRAAGRHAIHVLLCNHMRSRFCELYGVQLPRAEVLSSVMFAEPEIRAASGRVRTRLGAIGYLGNLSADKGIWEFLTVIASLRAEHSRLQVRIAGPGADPEATSAVIKLAAQDPLTHYWGPVYQADKVRFLDEVDVLLFPSRYPHEAAPLVIFEALAVGIPVISTDVGCLRTFDPTSGVVVVQNSTEFSDRATDAIDLWLRDPGLYAATSAAARQHFVSRLEVADTETLRILATLAGGRG